MSPVQTQFFKTNDEKIIFLIKIIVLSITTIYLFSSFVPYFEGWDSYIYGLAAIRLDGGSYDYTNHYIQDANFLEFFPIGHVRTIEDSVIPAAMPGLPFLAFVSYSLFGLPGLLYLNPAITVILIFASERISSKFFGKYVGLITLLFVCFNYLIIFHGLRLLTENLFALLFLCGIFFLVRFLKENNTRLILFSSIFFASSSLIRINGLIFFPIEIFLILGLFFIKKTEYGSRCGFSSFEKPVISLKTVTYIILPWIVFFVILFGFNQHYFGDPLSFYPSSSVAYNQIANVNYFSFLEFDDRRFDYIKGYSEHILPFPLSAIPSFSEKYENIFGENWLGYVPIFLLITVIFISIRTKEKIPESLVFSSFIVGFLFFYSSELVSPFPHQTGRYMIPALPIFYMLLGYLITKIYHIKQKIRIIQLSKLIKPSIVTLLTIFFVISFTTHPSFSLFANDFTPRSFSEMSDRYPLDREGLTDDSIIVSTISFYALDYGVAPFYPFLGNPLLGEFDSDKVPQSSIDLLYDLIFSGKDIYVFKEDHFRFDKPYYNYLVTEKGFVLKEFSDSFCKLEIKSSNEESDKICL